WSYEPDAVHEVATTIVRYWRPLLDAGRSAGILLWVADGSELLDFDGRMDTRFAWAQHIGFVNLAHDPYPYPVPQGRQGVDYRPAPPQPTYADLARVVATLRQVARAELGIDVRIGTTFDAGPEFAESEFKYVRHPEVVAR